MMDSVGHYGIRRSPETHPYFPNAHALSPEYPREISNLAGEAFTPITRASTRGPVIVTYRFSYFREDCLPKPTYQ